MIPPMSRKSDLEVSRLNLAQMYIYQGWVREYNLEQSIPQATKEQMLCANRPPKIIKSSFTYASMDC